MNNSRLDWIVEHPVYLAPIEGSGCAASFGHGCGSQRVGDCLCHGNGKSEHFHADILGEGPVFWDSQRIRFLPPVCCNVCPISKNPEIKVALVNMGFPDGLYRPGLDK